MTAIDLVLEIARRCPGVSFGHYEHDGVLHLMAIRDGFARVVFTQPMATIGPETAAEIEKCLKLQVTQREGLSTLGPSA